MARRIAPETMDILQLIADGNTVKFISELRGISTHNVHQMKNRYPDVIAELQGKQMDGSPLRFAPGHGTESIAHIEQPEPAETEVENPEPITEDTNINSMKRHTIAELFQQIDELKAENAKLKEDYKAAESMMYEALAETAQENAMRTHAEEELADAKKQLAEAKGRTELDKGELLCFLLNEIGCSTQPTDYDFIRGISYALAHLC